MNLKVFYYKAKMKLHQKLFSRGKHDRPIFRRYSSYWHYVFHFKAGQEKDRTNFYLTARPNPGAGIGHQIANWNAGYWFSMQFGIKFAGQPFSNSVLPNSKGKWDDFLGFNLGEENAYALLKKGYKKVLLPKFKETREEVSFIEKIIDSYAGEKIVFFCEQDQFYRDQFGVMDLIRKKFYDVHPEKSLKLIFDKDTFNIAIHVRRGDIVQSIGEVNPNLTMRYQNNNYFVNALETALNFFADEKKIGIYLFSQGNEEDYPEFKKYNNVHFCLDMSAQDSFLHMVYADALITSKSSFSYKPALLNNGVKFCPAEFWHGYPKTDDWILLDEEGKIK